MEELKKVKENIESWLFFIDYGNNRPLIEFLFTWVSFETYLKSKSDIVVDAIHIVSRTERLVSIYEDLKQQDNSRMLQEYSDTKNGRDYILDLRDPEDKSKRVYFNGRKDSLEDFLLTMNVIRGNLIHGRKLIDNDETFRLLSWANRHFRPLWENFVVGIKVPNL